MRLSDLAAWDRNPRTIDGESAAGLQRSMQSFGDIAGITYNRRNGRLVSGHQRVDRLRSQCPLNVDPEITLLTATQGVLLIGEQQWPVRIVDWDEETHARANVAANNPQTQGDFDQLGLGNLLQDLAGDELFHALRFDALAEDMPQLVGEAAAGGRRDDGTLIPEMECQPYEHYDYVLVVSKTAQQWNRLVELLELPEVAVGEGGARRVGLGRAIFAQKLLQKLDPESAAP